MSLHHPVPTGTLLTDGVHRRRGDILTALHGSGSARVPTVLGTSSTAKNRSGHSSRLREIRTQCERDSSPELGIPGQVQKISRDADWPFRVRVVDYQLDFAFAGCGRHCATTIFWAPHRPGVCSRVRHSFHRGRHVRNFATSCAYFTIGESVSSSSSVKRAWGEYTVCVGGTALAYFVEMQWRISFCFS